MKIIDYVNPLLSYNTFCEIGLREFSTDLKFNLPNGWSKNQHLTGCGVFSDPKRQWVLHMTKP